MEAEKGPKGGKKARIGGEIKAMAVPKAKVNKVIIVGEKVPAAVTAEAANKGPEAKVVLVIKIMAVEKKAPVVAPEAMADRDRDKVKVPEAKVPMADAKLVSDKKKSEKEVRSAGNFSGLVFDSFPVI